MPAVKRADAKSGLWSKADDLEALRTNVVDAAAVGGGLWFSYLSVLFYLLIAAGTVTHEQLLLETPVKLPLLSVDLSQKGFFALGPALFITAHAYVLLHLAVLGGKVRAFDEAFRAQINSETVRTKLRRQLPNNVFVQFLAGPRDVRTGVLGWLLYAIAFVTLGFGPMGLLLFFLAQYLPYQSEAMTWWHRIAVALDFALIWAVWPTVMTREPVAEPPRLPARVRRCLASLRAWSMQATAVFLAGLMLAVATFPGEALDDVWRGIAARPYFGWVGWPRTFLFEGEADAVTRRPSSLFANRLVLPSFRVLDALKLDDTKLASMTTTLPLRGRNLRQAVLFDADLRKADLSGASMQGADLSDAWMQGADLTGASMQGADLSGTSMQGAALSGTSMQGADLTGASMQGALIRYAFVWRAGIPETPASQTDAYTREPNMSRVFRCQSGRLCDWDSQQFAAFRAALVGAVPAGHRRDQALQRIDAWLDPDRPLDREAPSASFWQDMRDASAEPGALDRAERERVAQLVPAACEKENGPWTARGLIRRANGLVLIGEPLFSPDSPHLAVFAAGLLTNCPGASDLTAEEVALLKQWRDETANAPKQ